MSGLALGLLVDGVARSVPPAERPRAIVDEAVRAEALGFDSVWLADAPVATVVAAIAARTARVRIGGAVDLAADLDPVRVAEDWATADAIADGRVELVACGAASDTEESRERLRERVELLRRLWSETGVTWSGRFRPPLDAVTLEPRPVQRPHPPIWIRADSASAVDLAATLGLPVLLAGAGDGAARAARYRERLAAAGRDPARARVGCCQRVRLAQSSRGALRPDADAITGSPAEVAERIVAAREALGLALHVSRFDASGLGPAEVERFAAEVAPQLRG